MLCIMPIYLLDTQSAFALLLIYLFTVLPKDTLANLGMEPPIPELGDSHSTPEPQPLRHILLTGFISLSKAANILKYFLDCKKLDERSF